MKNIKKLGAFLAAVIILGSISLSALAAVPTRPQNNYILDDAKVFSDSFEKYVVAENTKIFKETGAEIVIVAVDFTGAADIEDYSYELFNSWGIGSSERNNGVLLVLAIGEEVYQSLSGYGISDFFNGAKTQDMLDTYLEPDFDRGDYEEGARKYFDAVLAEIKSYYRTYEDEHSAGEFTQGSDYISKYDNNRYDDYDDGYSYSSSFSFSSIFRTIAGIVVGIIIFAVVIVIIITATKGGGGGGYRGGGGGGNFWTGMLLGSMMNRNRRGPRPPFGGGGFGGTGGFGVGSRGGSGGFGGFTGGGRTGGFGGGSRGGGGGFTGGGGTRGGGAGRR